jgi:peroxiredoxin
MGENDGISLALRLQAHTRPPRSTFVEGTVMTARNCLAAALTALLCSLPALFGQDGPQPAEGPGKAGVLPGHSAHGEVFNEGPRQKAYLMGGTGKVHFAVTTRVPLAQQFFDQGIGQLHGFWYFEAERSFRQIARLDSNCAMAYWGMAMANIENEKRAQGFIQEAVKRKKNASRREQLWIDGLAEYLLSKKDRKSRRRAYLQSLERIIHEFPDDIEARAFLAVRIWQFESDWPLSSRQAVDALLEQVFAVNPMHPAHHYRIHLWDREKPEWALGSAARCGQAAPTIAHMWHMPGHIYSRLHRYADAVWQQEASSRADHAHMVRDRVLPDQIHNYAHNQEWLTRNLIHIGRAHDALALAKNLVELPRHPTYNTIQRRGRSASYGRMRLFQVLEAYEMWDEVLALAGTMYLEPTSLLAEQVKRIRLLGLAYAGKGDREKLKGQIAELERRANGKPAAKGKTKPAARKPTGPLAQSIQSALNELKGYQALLDGKGKEALGFFKKVRGLNRTTQARLHWRAGEKARAEELARQDVDASPNEVLPLANYIEILYGLGKKKEVAAQFAGLRKISGHIDSLSLPAFSRLAPVAQALKLSADWRVPAVPAQDVGERPDLAKIGPFRWYPPKAPGWTLLDATGKKVSLAQYRGRPVVVIFYLGHGCLHCVEQLHKFGPKTKDFTAAGISLVAISTDPHADLEKALANYEGKAPFPLVSDAELGVFKSYRAYDDFEDQPLHGTFLIDGSGRIRWQDISYEPFNDADFLLKEAQRLLQVPAESGERSASR